MIFTQAKLIIAGVSLLATLGFFTWIYFQGKEEARQECLIEQTKVIQLWEDKLKDAQDKNKVLAEDLANTVTELDKAKSARVKRIIKYVENDPTSDTVIFDDVGLQILNDAQKGINTNSE